MIYTVHTNSPGSKVKYATLDVFLTCVWCGDRGPKEFAVYPNADGSVRSYFVGCDKSKTIIFKLEISHKKVELYFPDMIKSTAVIDKFFVREESY